jgi:hypothetical protein
MNSLRNGLSVIIGGAGLQDRPPDRAFWTALCHILSLSPSITNGDCKKCTLPPAFKNRADLTQWAVYTLQLKIWDGAADAIDSPEQWGPHVWQMLHGLARLYTPYLKRYFATILRSLPNILPCTICAHNLRTLMRSKEFTIQHKRAQRSSARYVEFMGWFHTQVSRKIQKQ